MANPAPASNELSESQLSGLCRAVGWQGGTYWQVLEEVGRLKRLEQAATTCAKCGMVPSAHRPCCPYATCPHGAAPSEQAKAKSDPPEMVAAEFDRMVDRAAGAPACTVCGGSKEIRRRDFTPGGRPIQCVDPCPACSTTALLNEAHDLLHKLVAVFVPDTDGAHAEATDLMTRIRAPGVMAVAPWNVDDLMQLVFRYGAARCDVDRSNSAGNQRACNEAIDAIRGYIAKLTHGVAPTAPVEPMDAWVAYAKRSGLLDANGEAPDRAKAQTAFYAYSAAWNEACTHGVAPTEPPSKKAE